MRTVRGDNEEVKTLLLTVDPSGLNETDVLDRAAGILRAGGLVALPTETVYGLGANALDRAAVSRIFAAKQRPAWDPVIVHIADAAMLAVLVSEIPDAARSRVDKLIEHFWPGPLTLLLPRSDEVPNAVTAGRPLVGVRMPAHPVALELIRRAEVPIAAPSANLFGHISPTTAAHVLHDLGGRIDAVLAAGPTEHGVESTVLDPCQSPMVIYRPGAVTLEQIRVVAGPVDVYRESAELSATPMESLPSPGVGLRHYAPRARLILVEGTAEDMAYRLEQTSLEIKQERIGVMLPADLHAHGFLRNSHIYPWGAWSKPEEMAHELYSGLRALDALGCTVILCPLPPSEGIGAALRDRLRKAAAMAEQ